jgi:tight adherence protein B
MRLARGAVAAAILALAVAAPAGAAPVGPKITPSTGVRFPDRAYVVTLPKGAKLDKRSVHVTENGRGVANVSLVPARLARSRTFSVVLVLDASRSMAGEPIRAAVAAARAFTSHLNANERIGIVTFNSSAHVVLPLTGDRQAIAQALASPPPLATGTHIYDAVGSAVDMLAVSGSGNGSVVLMSDGADTGSDLSLDKAVAEAAAKHVRVYAVGLRSSTFRRSSLEAVAKGADGGYFEARSLSGLSGIYDALGRALSRQYILRYRSEAPANVLVHVRIVVDGVPGAATASYRTPKLPVVTTPAYEPSLGYRFWRSPVAMIFVAALVALLIGGFTAAALRPRTSPFRRRMAEFVSVDEPSRGRTQPKSSVLADLYEGTEDRLGGVRWWERFKEDLELAEIRTPASQIAIWTLVATVVLGWLVVALSGIPFAAVLALGLPLAVRGVVVGKVARRRQLFSQQLPDNLQVLASAMRAGHSFIGALSVVVDDCVEPSRSEFRRVIADEQLGVPLEDALNVVVRRMDNTDLGQVALLAALQRETGGNTAEVLDRVTDNIRERFELRRLVKTLTAQGRASRWIVTAIPIGLLLLVTAINRDYMAPLYHTGVGHALLIMAAVMVTAGSFVIKRIVDIKV